MAAGNSILCSASCSVMSNLYILVLQTEYPQVKAIHVFGLPSEEFQNDFFSHGSIIEEEQRKYCDVVQFDFIDTYENITLDTISALKFVMGYQWKLGDEPSFIAITDDDNYVNIPDVYARISHYTTKKSINKVNCI